jgi:exodeoxyribonuclease VII large subunit
MAESSVMTVTQLTWSIKTTLEERFRVVSVQGEISNFKRQSSGHLYFSLKDVDAQVSAVMFRGDAQRLKVMPKEGDQVVIRGEISVYPPHGKYQILVRDIQLCGLGELLLKLEALKQDINRRGWFDAKHKKSLPKFPKTIGVVTSPTGAAIQDILNVLRRRFSGFHMILSPVRVQGEGAAREIAQAIHDFNTYNNVDVMIIGRGGGSIEDLWAFNEEIVAQAVFESRIPIIAAVGHETDHTIAEYVADVRAPTPSAAAELVVSEKAQHIHALDQMRTRLQQTLLHLMKQARHRLERYSHHPLLTSPYNLLGQYEQKIDDMRTALDEGMKRRITTCRLQLEGRQRQAGALSPYNKVIEAQQQLARLSKRLTSSMYGVISLSGERLKSITKNLSSIDPKNVLKRGYSIIFSKKTNSVIVSRQQIEPEEELDIMMADGKVAVTVQDVEFHNE